jgi:hypothetical protein
MADIALAQQKAAAEIELKRQELAAQTTIDATAAGIQAVRSY